MFNFFGASKPMEDGANASARQLALKVRASQRVSRFVMNHVNHDDDHMIHVWLSLSLSLLYVCVHCVLT